jgi:hypothetical protein
MFSTHNFDQYAREARALAIGDESVCESQAQSFACACFNKGVENLAPRAAGSIPVLPD